MALTLNGDNTASTPGYAGSDSDTGLQPGTNELDLVTGGTSRLKINSSGLVGIGTTNPDTMLDIQGSGPIAKVVATTQTNARMRIQAGNTSSSYLEFGDSDDDDVGEIVYDHSNNSMRFRTAGTPHVYLDSSGRLLVGASSDITGGANISAMQVVNGVGGGLILGRNDTSTSPNDILGLVRFYGNDSDGNYDECGRISVQADAEHTSTSKASRMVFYTNSGTENVTERMRITSAGNVGINYTSQTAKLEVKEDTSSAETVVFRIRSNWSSSSQTQMLVLSDGDVENRNNAYRAISDAKLKENIADANSQWEDIKSLRVRNYNFIEGAGDPSKKHIGLIAQETELVSPGLVAERADQDNEGNDLGTTTKSVNYSVLYMKSVKALQEAMERIEQLETRVAQLEGGAS